MNILLLSLGFLVLSLTANAKTYYLPSCQINGVDNIIKIENPTQEMSSVDLYIKRNSQLLPEIKRISIEAKGSSFINLHDHCDQGNVAWIKPHISHQNKLHLVWQWQDRNYPLSSDLSNSWNSFINKGNQLLQIQNHSHSTNKLEIKFFDKNSRKLATHTDKLSSFALRNIAIPQNTYRVHVNTQYRSHSFTYSLQGENQQSQAGDSLNINTDEFKIYFLLAHQNNREEKSYVVALEDKELISLARRAIREPFNESIPRIVMGKVEAHNGSYNHHWNTKKPVNWSWQLTDVSFAGVSFIDCDTNPQLIEENLPAFIKSKALVCPWNYRIVEELVP